MPPPLRCPICDRALQLRDEHRGAMVQCPLCRTTFQAPAATEGYYVPDAPSLEPFRPQTSPGAERLDLPPRPPIPAVPLSPKDRDDVAAAARWLRFISVLHALSGACCLLNGELPFCAPLLVVVVILKVPPVFLAWSAARRLLAFRDPRFCHFTLVYLCVMAAASLAEVVLGVWESMSRGFYGEVAPWVMTFSAFPAATFFLALFTVVRGFNVLSNPRIKAHFR
jgi:hypothetical protein